MSATAQFDSSKFNILFTAHSTVNPDGYTRSLTQRVYMSLLSEGNTDKYPDLAFHALTPKKLVSDGGVELFREQCKEADFIYHYGPVFDEDLKAAGASKELRRKFHHIVFDEFGHKSVCRNEKVCDEKNPDSKAFHYESVRKADKEKEVPLVQSYSYGEIRERFETDKEITLPIVFKDPNMDNGWGCFMIKTTKQLKILFDDKKFEEAEKDAGATEGSYKKMVEGCIFQDFVPSVLADQGKVSHARVLVHATARKIIGMTLFHAQLPSDYVTSPGYDPIGFVSQFSDFSSPLYLEAKAVKPQKDSVIAVAPLTSESKPLVRGDKEVLAAHSITHGEIPKDLQTLALTFGDIMAQRGMGGLIGIDVIYDANAKVWRLLEGNFPASGSFKTLFGYRSGKYATPIRIQHVLEAWQEHAVVALKEKSAAVAK